jgi:hypothetical protein
MPGITINLTDEEYKALELKYDTEDLQGVLQKNVEVMAQNYIRDQYKRAIAEKSIADLKTFCPDVKVERVPPVVVEPKKEVEVEVNAEDNAEKNT